MNKEPEDQGWPEIASEPERLEKDVAPPADLEHRVVETLAARGLLETGQAPVTQHVGLRVMRSSLAMAACTALFAVGIVFGRLSMDGTDLPAGTLTGGEQDLYALLLYETGGYDKASGAELRTRYGEYSQWVAEARRRDQFVTGEDLEIERGWLLLPAEDGTLTLERTSVDGDATLSGIFFIRARDAEQALALARELPHIRHGGPVLVQKTIPTDQPPE